MAGINYLEIRWNWNGDLHVRAGSPLKSVFSNFKGIGAPLKCWMPKMWGRGGGGEGVLYFSTKFYLMNPTEKCRPATWWQNNGVSDLWLAINSSGFQAHILQTGVLRVRPHTDTSPAVHFQQLTEFPFLFLTKGLKKTNKQLVGWRVETILSIIFIWGGKKKFWEETPATLRLNYEYLPCCDWSLTKPLFLYLRGRTMSAARTYNSYKNHKKTFQIDLIINMLGSQSPSQQ